MPTSPYPAARFVNKHRLGFNTHSPCPVLSLQDFTTNLHWHVAHSSNHRQIRVPHLFAASSRKAGRPRTPPVRFQEPHTASGHRPPAAGFRSLPRPHRGEHLIPQSSREISFKPFAENKPPQAQDGSMSTPPRSPQSPKPGGKLPTPPPCAGRHPSLQKPVIDRK